MSIGVTRYLVRPQSPGCPSIWLQVHCVDSEDVPSARRLMRLRDITDHVGRYTQIWQLAAASLELSTAMSLLLPAVEALGTATESLPGQRPDEWLRQAHAASLRLRQATENIMRLANATRLSHLRDRLAVAEFPGIVQRLAAGLDLPPTTVFVEPDAENVHLALAVADIELIVGEIMEGAKQFHPRRSPQLDISVAGPTDGRLRLAFGCDDAGPTPEQMSRAWTPLDQSPSSPANERPAIAADLSIVSALVWGLGGRYRIQPRQPGPGAVVDVILPRAGDEE
jgi:K+-sensing histidine kinase KdpD